MKLDQALAHCVRGERLSRAQAREVFAHTLDADVDPAQLGAFLAALATRGETASEVAGAADALRDAMLPFEHDFEDAIDTCGTGGDGLGTFNISTASAVVAAAAGARVIKHGNRAASSKCGSADLLEAAGIPLELPPRAARTVLEEVGITFLFAPAFHPALRHAAPVRRALGVRTVFNLLGPLVNPGRVRRQLLGLGDGTRVDLMAEVLAELEIERAFVVHGSGGADELTLSGVNRLLAVGSDAAHAAGWDAVDLGLDAAPIEALAGGDVERNLALFGRLLDAEHDPLFDAVALNAGAALVVAGVTDSPAEALQRAREALDSGAARRTFDAWRSCARALGRDS